MSSMPCDTREQVGDITRSFSQCVSKAKPIKEVGNEAWGKLGQLSITASSNWNVRSSITSKQASLRSSFDTPEARHSFCLSAFRPASDTDGDSELGSDDSNASSVGIEDEQHALSISPKLGFSRGYSLQRTDKPVTDLIADLHVTSGTTASSSTLRRTPGKAQQNVQHAPPQGSSLRSDELWSGVSPRIISNPFEGHLNDAGFFGCPPKEIS